MVASLIMAFLELVTGKFFKAALYVCLFMFLENLLIADPPVDMIPIYKAYLILGIVLEAVKWFIVKAWKWNNRPGLVKSLAQEEITLVNRNGTWVPKNGRGPYRSPLGRRLQGSRRRIGGRA